MDHLLLVLLLLWSSALTFSSGLQAEGSHTSTGARCDTTAKADIVLLVDGSGSIGNLEFEIFKSFISSIVRNLHIGPDRVQIGLVQYSFRPQTEWHLNTYQTTYSLLGATSSLRQITGGTMTGMALNFTLQNNFQPDVGMRADSQKIVVLLTDGESQDDTRLPSQKLKDAGIEIYAIGVRGAKESELKSIASEPTEIHTYSVTDFSFLPAIVDNLTINLCDNSKILEPVRLDAVVISRLVVLPLLFIAAICFIHKATRGQKPDPQENVELDYYNLGVCRAEGGPAEEEGAQAGE
ncbi:collagen alpha-1(XII) chain-like [Micropterus dolomieu]|uniref:collagen alpha-1(XII) chain-like n=1 Tax=Micropterus dolomieu TaxID=147949 RepID=UPI001E8EA42F|nr:collagen alpha-1(XII) chain-like [Micropterus dolomieu]